MERSSDSVRANSCLREEPLKRILKNFIVLPVIDKYLTVGIRVLWNEDRMQSCMEKEQQLQGIFKNMKQVKMFVSCVTAVKSKDYLAGICYWLAYDFPEITAKKFENMICQKILKAGFDVSSCKSVNGRGMKFLKYSIPYFHTN